MPTKISPHMETLKKVRGKVSKFVLTIRNKSLYSGKIKTYLNIERMSLNLLITLPKKITEMQIFCSGVDGIKVQLWEAMRVTGHEYRKMDYGVALRWGCYCQNRLVSKRWHPSFNPHLQNNKIHLELCRRVSSARSAEIPQYVLSLWVRNVCTPKQCICLRGSSAPLRGRSAVLYRHRAPAGTSRRHARAQHSDESGSDHPTTLLPPQ